MQKRSRPVRMGAVLALLAMVAAAACTSGDDTTGASVSEEGPASDGSFEELLEAARESDHVVRTALSGEAPEVVEAREAAFEERFGFPLELEIEPGHGSREVPTEIIQAAASDTPVVDTLVGTIANYIILFDEGLFRRPDWAALESEWPIIADLREAMPDVETAAGGPMRDYCAFQADGPWVPFINTDRVDPSEVEGFTWDDLTDDTWRGRLAWDVEAAGMFVFPYADGWDEERLTEYAAAIGDNAPILVPGGSAGVIQSVLQGEGDIGVAVESLVAGAIADGAPLQTVIPEDFLPTAGRAGCLVTPSGNSVEMATLYLGWYLAERMYDEVEDPSFGGWQRLFPEEAEHFPLAEQVEAAGLTRDDFAFPQTREEFDAQEGYRDIAKEGMGA